MLLAHELTAFRYLVQKDLQREYRTRRVWPSTLLLGVVLVLILALNLDLPLKFRIQIGSGLFWSAAFFAGTTMLDRLFLSERDQDCWRSLQLFPVSPITIFLAKLTVNLLGVTALEIVLLPLFVLLADLPCATRPFELGAILLLANIGFCAVGSLLGALTISLRNGGQFLALLLLPLTLPVLLCAAAATRELVSTEMTANTGPWIQVLAVFAIVFVSAGSLLFEFVMEG